MMAKSGLFLFVWLGWWVLFGVVCCFSCCVCFVILVWVCFSVVLWRSWLCDYSCLLVGGIVWYSVVGVGFGLGFCLLVYFGFVLWLFIWLL